MTKQEKSERSCRIFFFRPVEIEGFLVVCKRELSFDLPNSSSVSKSIDIGIMLYMSDLQISTCQIVRICFLRFVLLLLYSVLNDPRGLISRKAKQTSLGCRSYVKTDIISTCCSSVILGAEMS